MNNFSKIYLAVSAALLLVLSSSGCAPTQKKPIPVIPDVIARQITKDDVESRMAFSSAEKAFNNREYDKALGLYADFINSYPESAMADDAWFRKGEIHLKNRENDEAVISFRKIIIEYPESDMFMEAQYRLSLAHFMKGDYDEAISSLKSLLDAPLSKERRVAASTTIGDAYLNLGRNIDAIDWYSRALEMGPDKKVEKKIISRVDAVLEKRMTEEELNEASFLLKGKFLGEYASYALISRKVDGGLYEEARTEVGEFIETADYDQLKLMGEELLQVIVQRMDVNANTIGCILPLSGRFASYGKSMLKGVQLAAGVFGGGDGPPINLIIKDSKGDPEEAEKAVRELVEKDKVIAIVGPITSDAAQRAADLAQGMGVPIMTLSKMNGLPETGEYAFRNSLTMRNQTKTLAQYVVKEMGLKRFAIMYPMDSYGEEMMNLFWNDVSVAGGEVVGIEGYGKGQYDFGKEIKRLVGMDKIDKKEEEVKEEFEKIRPVVDFEAIFIPDSYEKAGLMASQLVYNDVEGVRLLGTNSWNSKKLVEIGGKYVDGALFAAGFYAESKRESTRNFTEKFRSAFDETPGILEAIAFDAAKMIVDAIGKGESRSRVEVKNYLLSIENFNGATGRTTVTEFGDVDKDIFLLTVNKDRIEEIERAEDELTEELQEEEEAPLIQ